MWHDICLANREAVLQMLARFTADLQELSQAIEAGESQRILDTFSRAKAARDAFCGH